MAIERDFVQKGMRRSQIDEFLADELRRAGYGGMELARTPMGTEITLKAEKPGMVIGKGGKNIRALTDSLEEQFDLEDLQIDVQEVEEPDLNARIVADKLANALERGWYFRDAGQTTLRRIMDSGARGAEIVFSGKVTGARARVEKFKDGYIKHCGEPAEEIVERGQGTAVMKLGTIGVQVSIIPPGAELPDTFAVDSDADVEELIPEAQKGEVKVEDAEASEAEGIEEVVEEATEGERAETEAEDEEIEQVEEAEIEEVEIEEDESRDEPEMEEVEETQEESGEVESAESDEPEETEGTTPETEDTEPDEAEKRKENEEETAPSEPDDYAELEEFSYRDLQTLAKEHDIKANLKTEELVEELAEEYDLDEEVN